MKKKVFISLTADNIHHGHINLINEGKKYGNVVIGLLTDKAVATHKKLPILNYEQRKLIIKNISGVSEVIPQPEWDDSLIIDKVKPDNKRKMMDMINSGTKSQFLKLQQLAMKAVK